MSEDGSLRAPVENDPVAKVEALVMSLHEQACERIAAALRDGESIVPMYSPAMQEWLISALGERLDRGEVGHG